MVLTSALEVAEISLEVAPISVVVAAISLAVACCCLEVAEISFAESSETLKSRHLHLANQLGDVVDHAVEAVRRGRRTRSRRSCFTRLVKSP